jgi:mono/diheme cytochrome c family protein
VSRPRIRSLFLIVVATLAATIGVAACSSDDPVSGTATGSLVDQGSAVYAESCASCHGSDLTGTDKGPSFLSIVYEPNHHDDGSFRRAIAQGAPQHHWDFGDMEPIRDLDDEDVDAVIAFVRAEQERRGFER